MVDWKNVEGFHSIAVAERIIANKAQLAGILVFNSPVSEDYYRLFNLPTHIQVQSSIKPLQKEEESIPLLLEWMTTPVPCSGDIINTEAAVEALPLTTLFLQSGDVVAGCNQAGRLGDEQAVTLTTFVIPHNSSTLADIRLLTVHHGFQGGYTEIHSCEIDSFVKIGEISYVSHVQKDLAQKLDVSLIKPLNPLQVNPLLKWIPVVPKPPVMATRGMFVQMYGGVSKHQTGYIDYSEMINLGPISSAIPCFTAIVPSQPGDSGSLLVIGNEAGDPFAHATTEGYSKEWLEAVRFAMAGILIEGSVAGTYLNMTVFRPMSTVFQYLKVRAAYPSFESSFGTESLQSHSEDN